MMANSKVHFLMLVLVFKVSRVQGALVDKRLLSPNIVLGISDPTNYSSYEEATESNEPNDTQKPPSPESSSTQTPFRCNLSETLIKEISSYKLIANKIFKTLLSGSFKGRTYNDLSYFVDRFGSRIAGSENLEMSIDYMLNKMKKDGLENVHGEEVIIPHWIRGEESAILISPRRKKLAILGLGYSVGTAAEGITAEVLVVKSFDELKAKANEVRGKIVVYNEDFLSYGVTVDYRSRGASEASKLGALATLIRSVTDFSISSPHTGMQTYETNVTKIPTACICIEDAELLWRMQKRGDKLIIQLKMNDSMLTQDAVSRNAVAEIRGWENPDQVVVVSGHVDSWDVGEGAMDDGGGMFISVEALALIKRLKLRARRTLRVILWTAEEFGLIGVQEYLRKHSSEMDQFVTVFESDIGTFKPLGLDFSGSDEAGCILQEVLKLMAPINATKYRKQHEVGSDIGYFIQAGVPGVSLNTENSKYFYFHHSEGDTMTVENSNELDLCTAVWAAASYVLADLSVSLPK